MAGVRAKRGSGERESDGRGKAASSPRDRVVLEGALWKRISELRSFVETAYETVYKAVKKHDKITKITRMDSVSIDTEDARVCR